MGTTFSSIHIFSPVDKCTEPGFLSFSDGWYTYVSENITENPFDDQKIAKQLSKKIDKPVLWFYIFDSDIIIFEFYRGGKRVACYNQEDPTLCKGILGVAPLIGYESSQKRRLSNILSCADVDFQLNLLEEYFGVCLIPDIEMIAEPGGTFRRTRGDQYYQEFLLEEKKLAGNNALVKAELVFEKTGKIFSHRFGDQDTSFIRKHYYLFGYDTFDSNFQNGALRSVHFLNGELVPVTDEEFNAVKKVPRSDLEKHDKYTEAPYPSRKIRFTEKAPSELCNKVLTVPRGYDFLEFDEKGRVLLFNERGVLLVLDSELKVIAKLRLKGEPVDFVDGYVLTAGGRSSWVYCYNPSDVVRIYRLYED